MKTISEAIDFVLRAGIWGTLLLGLLLRIGKAMRHVCTQFRHRRDMRPDGPLADGVLLLIIGMMLAATIALPSSAAAGQQGWWWGSPINPGFDKNTVVQVTGTAGQVDLAPRSGPSTVRLDTSDESITVMLGPGWYLAEARVDIRPGDPLIVEGSKIMDRRGHLHLVAANITNQRTGVVLTLRDETGRPVWMSARPSGRK